MIFFLIAPSCAGKDLIMKMLLQDEDLDLRMLGMFTTRPMRNGEKQGEPYHFGTMDDMVYLKEQDRIIESRSYTTNKGIWHYGTMLPEDFDPKKDYIYTATIESYHKIFQFFKGYNWKHCCEVQLYPIYIQVSEKTRLQRAIDQRPDLIEACRRFIADATDFSEENVASIPCMKTFENEKELPVKQIKDYILSKKGR